MKKLPGGGSVTPGEDAPGPSEPHAPDVADEMLKRLSDLLRLKRAVEQAREFSEAVVKHAFFRAHGRCECVDPICPSHITGRCGAELALTDRRTSAGAGTWEADHVVPWEDGGLSTLANCQILCVACHEWKTAREREGRGG